MLFRSTADDNNKISANRIENFFEFILRRIDLTRDVHFYTNTTIDTLDYSGTSLNLGSKVVFAAYGDIKRELFIDVPYSLKNLQEFFNPKIGLPGVICISAPIFKTYSTAERDIGILTQQLLPEIKNLHGIQMIILCDDSNFASDSLSNFLWVTFTRCNPANDIYGIDSFYNFKHWGCNGPLVIDARIKPHHAPAVEKDIKIENKIERVFNKGGSLYGVIK